MIEQEMTAEERYEIVKQEMVCPDCGSDLRRVHMRDVATAVDAGPWDAEDVGYACTGADPVRGPCNYFINAGEKEDAPSAEA